MTLYEVSDLSGQIIAKYFYHPRQHCIAAYSKNIKVEQESRLWGKPKYLLIDSDNYKQIGEYCISNDRHLIGFSNDMPSFPTGTVNLNDRFYNFLRIKPDVKYSIFKRETWGFFKFCLYSIKGQEKVEYSFKLDVPDWRSPNWLREQIFDGEIISNSNDLLAILTGFFFMELELDYEDRKFDG